MKMKRIQGKQKERRTYTSLPPLDEVLLVDAFLVTRNPRKHGLSAHVHDLAALIRRRRVLHAGHVEDRRSCAKTASTRDRDCACEKEKGRRTEIHNSGEFVRDPSCLGIDLHTGGEFAGEGNTDATWSSLSRILKSLNWKQN